jgi:hypothetical protein
MQNQGNGPNWPAATVALGFLAFVGLIFWAVYVKDGMDGATKAWALIGTVVGVITGSIPSYFFHQAATDAQKDAKAAALSMSNDQQSIQRFQELRAKM